MIAAFLLSIGQLGDRRLLAVLAKSLAVTLMLLATLGAGLWVAGAALARRAGYAAGSGIAGVVALIAGIAFGWLIFRALAIAVVGLFADDVVAAVEARHYPQALAAARPVPLSRSLPMGAGSAARALAWNAAALPLYLMLLATGIGTAIGFFAVNAVLLGRDLGDMIAARHLPQAKLPGFRRATRLPRLMLGSVGTALLLIPVVNIVAPVLSAAMATHLFHRRLTP